MTWKLSRQAMVLGALWIHPCRGLNDPPGEPSGGIHKIPLNVVLEGLLFPTSGHFALCVLLVDRLRDTLAAFGGFTGVVSVVERCRVNDPFTTLAGNAAQVLGYCDSGVS